MTTLNLAPTLQETLDVFAEEITRLGGTVSESVDDGQRLFARSVLPAVRDVRAGDAVQGGVAIRSVSASLLVHPYVYRKVCRNGAIMARTVDTHRVERVEAPASEEMIESAVCALRDAVRAAAEPSMFGQSVDRMRTAAEVEADVALHMLPLVSALPPGTRTRVLARILARFDTGEDRSVFGLMNAVTSLARDTRDPRTRWRLEEVGGAIPARLERPPTPGGRHAGTTWIEFVERGEPVGV